MEGGDGDMKELLDEYIEHSLTLLEKQITGIRTHPRSGLMYLGMLESGIKDLRKFLEVRSTLFSIQEMKDNGR
jgi:hypothetical protein